MKNRKANTSVIPTLKTTVTNLFECCLSLRLLRQSIMRLESRFPTVLCALTIDMVLVLKLKFGNW